MMISDTTFLAGGILTEKQEILLKALAEKFVICLVFFCAVTIVKAVIMTVFEILSDFVDIPMKSVKFNMNAIYWICIIGLLIYFGISFHKIMNDF